MVAMMESESVVPGLEAEEIKQACEVSQRGVLAKLRQMEHEGVVENIRPLWIVNAVLFDVVCDEDRSKVSYELDDVVGLKHIRPDRLIHVERILSLEGAAATVPQDTAWHVKKMGAPCMWEMGHRGQDAVIAVIDVGMDTTHPDLNERVWLNTNEIPGNGVDDDNNGYVDDYIGYDFYNGDPDPADDNGRGTMVSGIIAGDGTSWIHTGVAPDSKLMTLKCFSAGGAGRESDIWEAIQYAVDNGAQVINASFSFLSGDRDLWRATCDIAMSAGVIVSASAGAYSPSCEAPDCIHSMGDVPPPWLHPDQEIKGTVSGVVTVGTTDSLDMVGSFSSVGPVDWPDFPYEPPDSSGLLKPDISAPGIIVVTTQLGGGYTIVSGNSFSTAAVSGALALLISSRTGSTPAELDRSLELSAVDLDIAGKDSVSGSGRIDVCEAWELLGVGEGKRLDGSSVASGVRARPNPFSEAATIVVLIRGKDQERRNSSCTLTIYDLAGRRVRIYTLSGPGTETSVVWDGRSDLGRPVPPGLYFVKVVAGGAYSTTKLVLVR